ncbi:hypothetical protein [Streptomyces violascens]|uniref:hypothetical protein n=1 Tax=Streptomyces violascens TaxID=67381 RepID=UPI001679FA0D|nr:hypothetical protein [Streptomyces violascens]GGU39248.1 hypothetical protein GCM10010289_70210 [Streptomyces violascens]
MDITQAEAAAINRSKVVIARGHLAGYKGFAIGYGSAYDSVRIYLTDDNGDIFDKVSVCRSQVDLVTTPETIDKDKEEARQATARGASGHTPDPNARRKTPEAADNTENVPTATEDAAGPAVYHAPSGLTITSTIGNGPEGHEVVRKSVEELRKHGYLPADTVYPVPAELAVAFLAP